VRNRFWIEAALAGGSGFLFLLTLVSREWIELVFGAGADGGSGALEWAIVLALMASTAVFGLLARAEHARGAVADS